MKRKHIHWLKNPNGRMFMNRMMFPAYQILPHIVRVRELFFYHQWFFPKIQTNDE